MPSGTCSRRAGFADTIRLVASLIVLGCSIAARTAENAFGKRKKRDRERRQLAQGAQPQNARCAALLWHGTGRSRHSVAACRVSQLRRCNGAPILRRGGARRGGPNHDGRANAGDRKALVVPSFVCFGSQRCSIGELQTSSHGGAAPCAQASSPRSSPVFSWFPSPRRIECRRLRPTSLPTLRRKRPTRSRKGAAMRSEDRSSR